MPALAFSDPSHITCTSNDYGFEHVFERMVDAFGAPGDVFVAITTSGNSKNLILAAETAKRKGMKVVGLLGKNGGGIKAHCDIPIIVPGATSDRIQELHIKIIHIAIECAERRLFPNSIEMTSSFYTRHCRGEQESALPILTQAKQSVAFKPVSEFNLYRLQFVIRILLLVEFDSSQ